MTRLVANDVRSIAAQLSEYDTQLAAKTGCTLRTIACRAAGVPEDKIIPRLKSAHIGVIPITGGEGVIAGFCDAVAGIVSHLGCRAFITRVTDVAGLAEAFEKNADIIMLADDRRFIALHTASRKLIDNAVATGKGFVAGMHLMTGELSKKNVLVIGCGPVGRSATQALVAMGAWVSIYDIEPALGMALSEEIKKACNADIQVIQDLEGALKRHQLIVDASPARGIIQGRHITENTYISAPGVPHGLDQEARLKIGGRLLHDPLQIGVATMTMLALKFHRNASAG